MKCTCAYKVSGGMRHEETVEVESMNDNQSGVKAIAWRRLIRRRIAWEQIEKLRREGKLSPDY